MADLSVNIGDLKLCNPVMTASGTFGYGKEFEDFVDLEKIGGIIVKGTTLHHREGNPYPRMAETPMGMLNAVGLQNKGVDYFVEHIYPQIRDIHTNMIVNVSGSAVEDYVKTAEIINDLDHIPAIELNISCPNVKQCGMAFGVSACGCSEVVRGHLIRLGWAALAGPSRFLRFLIFSRSLFRFRRTATTRLFRFLRIGGLRCFSGGCRLWRFGGFRLFDFGAGVLSLFRHKFIDFVKGHNHIAGLRYGRPGLFLLGLKRCGLFGCGDRLGGLRGNILRRASIQFFIGHLRSSFSLKLHKFER